jgi:hypothetical protein
LIYLKRRSKTICESEPRRDNYCALGPYKSLHFAPRKIGRDGDSLDRQACSVVRNFACCIAFSFIPQLLRVRTKGSFMLDAKARERAETLFDRSQKREQELEDALKQEAARHEAAIANMRRLRALRLARRAPQVSSKA